MGTQPTRLEEKDRGLTMGLPTRPRDPKQKAHSLRHLIDKSCKICK
jgi:hypothetical protein